MIGRVVFVHQEAGVQCRGTQDGSADGIAKCPELTCGLWKEWSAHEILQSIYLRVTYIEKRLKSCLVYVFKKKPLLTALNLAHLLSFATGIVSGLIYSECFE